MFNTKYLLLPADIGTYDIGVSVIYEEYVKQDVFTQQAIVEENKDVGMVRTIMMARY